MSGSMVFLAQSGGSTQTPSMVGLPEGSQPLPTPGTVLQPAGPGPAAPASPFGGMQMMLIFLIPFALLIVMQTLGGRKEKKKREEMFSSMKKGDRVVTVGGIIGAIGEMYDDEIVLRLDDGKMRVTRASIQTVLKDPRARDEVSSGAEIEMKSGKSKAAV